MEKYLANKSTNVSDSNLKPSHNVPRTVTKKEAMELLHCSRSYIEQLAAKGVIRYWRPSYRHNLYSLDDIEKLYETPFNAAVTK